MKQKVLSQAQIYQKLTRYCAYQDRCSNDIIQKMKLWGQGDNNIKDVISYLQEEGFIDNTRFALSYARGKFRNNRWGKIKVREGLYMKKIQPSIIEQALNQIDNDEYLSLLQYLLEKKISQIKEEDPYKKKQKLALYLHSKGYELDLVWNSIKNYNNGESREY